MGKCLRALKVVALLGGEAAGAGLRLPLILFPKKRIPQRGFRKALTSSGQIQLTDGPSRARSGPATHGGGRRRSPRTPSPPRPGRALRRPAAQCGLGLPVVCVRQRASSNRSRHVEAIQAKSVSAAQRSTPPPFCFDPRTDRSETGFVQPRLQGGVRSRRGRAHPQWPRVETLGEEGAETGEPRGGGHRDHLQGQRWSPHAGPRRGHEGRNAPASCRTAGQGSQGSKLGSRPEL